MCKFTPNITNITDTIQRGDCGTEGTLTVKLANGLLTDSHGRIGSIVSNYQFQFDGPPAQAGAIYTGGFSACGNGSLAIGGSAVFYQCLSGDFYNLYDRSWAEQCSPVEIVILPCSGSSSTAPQNPAASQLSDGQVNGPSPGAVKPASPVISEKADGQPQVPTAAPPAISQIGDGQIQSPGKGNVVAPPAVTGSSNNGGSAPISQIGDGQIQSPGKGTAVAPPPAVTGSSNNGGSAPISQIGDGQIQSPGKGTVVPPPVATSPSNNGGSTPIGQIGDGQIQVPGKASAVSAKPPVVAPTTAVFKGAAPMLDIGIEAIALAAGAIAIWMF
jgi:hypothetical protein